MATECEQRPVTGLSENNTNLTELLPGGQANELVARVSTGGTPFMSASVLALDAAGLSGGTLETSHMIDSAIRFIELLPAGIQPGIYLINQTDGFATDRFAPIGTTRPAAIDFLHSLTSYTVKDGPIQLYSGVESAVVVLEQYAATNTATALIGTVYFLIAHKDLGAGSSRIDAVQRLKDTSFGAFAIGLLGDGLSEDVVAEIGVNGSFSTADSALLLDGTNSIIQSIQLFSEQFYQIETCAKAPPSAGTYDLEVSVATRGVAGTVTVPVDASLYSPGCSITD